jgi:general secretion pathway protein A
MLIPMVERLPQLDERMGVKCLLRPLTVEETMSYVQHRLALAGAQSSMFTSGALETVHRLSHGMPRRINRLCDLALLIAFADEQAMIEEAHIEAVSQELVTVEPD